MFFIIRDMFDNNVYDILSLLYRVSPKKVNYFLTNIFSSIDEPNSLKICTEYPWGIFNKSAKHLKD